MSDDSTDSTLDGRTVLITGGASGIGAALARRSARAGADVTVADVDDEAARALAAEIDGESVHLDVSSEGAWAGLVATHAPWDHVALNAGIMSTPPTAPLGSADLFSLDTEAYRRLFSVNVDGVVFGLRAMVPHMADHGGSIVATASVAGLHGWEIDPLYSSSKFAVVGLVRSIAKHLDQTNARAEVPTRLAAICPGIVRTALMPTEVADLPDGTIPIMDPDLIAAEIIDLWIRGANGEIRAKLTSDDASVTVDEPRLRQPTTDG